MSRFRMSRRAVLRGAGGVVVGLPLLECMLNRNGTALAGTGGPLPLRYLLCFGGFSLRGDLGTEVGFIPDAVGPGYDLKTCLQPLADFGVQDEVTVVSNMRIPRSPEERDAPEGGYSEFHWHGPPLLCGIRTQRAFDAVTPLPSSDQIVADAFAGQTTFDSLVYRTQALFYNLGGGIDVPDNRDTLSFRDQGGAVRPIVPTVSPQLAWQTLFTGFVPDDKAGAADAVAELTRRQSVLDVVDWRMSQLTGKLSAADKARLDEHWDHIRTLEGRLKVVETEGACELLPDPGEDPPLGGEFAGPGGSDINLGYSGEDERAEVFADLIAMALACDRTRVITWMITMWQSFMNAYQLTGHQWNTHDMHHGGTTPELQDMVTWHVQKWAGLIDRLQALPEGGGSVLDSCAVALLNEGGTGASLEGEGSHNTERMAFLLAGGAGGLKRGEHISLPEGTHATRVVITLMNAVGVPTTTLGEVSDELTELRS